MGKNTLEIDTNSRNRIVSETDRNFFVEAGAGSGKTTMLVKRMVAMVEQGKDISKICAITFTKAAAGEFYDRFQKLLIERSNPEYKYESKGYAGELPKPTKESMELCEKALQNIDLCFMGTIDSFCNMVLSEHPFDAKIPSDATLVTDDELQVFYSQILVEIGEGTYGDKLKAYYTAFRGVHRDAKEVFLYVIPQLMDRRNAHFNFTPMEPVDINAEFASTKAELCRVLRFIEAHPEIINAETKESSGAWSTILRHIRSVYGNWNNTYINILKVIKALEKARLYGTLEDHGAPNGDYVVFYQGARVSYGGFDGTAEIAEKLEKIQYAISMTFLINCIPVIEQKMKEKGYLSYFDYLFYLRNMLKNDAENGGKLTEYIFNRHSYYLIDEFQDTNPMQAEVFFYLCAKEANANWRNCIPKAGSLFIVGDPKQSIYRFRSADVTSFLEVKKLFTEEVGDVLYLACNFRSTDKLIKYYNRVFEKLLPEETEVQSKFEPIPEIKESKDAQGTFIYKGVYGKYENDFPEEIDRVQIRKIVQTLVNNPKYTIHTPDVKDAHPIRYKDIMVITYGKKTLPFIMKELNDHEIETKVEGKVLFEENEALKEIFRLYAAIADAKDEVALYAALIGKIIRLSPDELSKFASLGGKIRVGETYEEEQLKDEAFIKVYEKIQLIETLISNARRLSPAALFAKIMEDFKVYTVVEANSIEVLYYTLELMRNAERSGIVVSHIDGMNYLITLLSGQSEEERCLSVQEERDCVHLANLHKLKGLEAPVVILAAAANTSHGASIRVEHTGDQTEGYVFREESEWDELYHSTVYFSTPDYGEESTKEAAALSAEADRLIYVAATRARNLLIISKCVKHRVTKAGLKEELNCRWLPIIEDDTPQFFENFSNDKPYTVDRGASLADNLYEKAEKECVLNGREAEGITYQIESPSLLKVASKISDEDVIVLPQDPEIGEEQKEERISRRFPALLGTSIHRLMELLISSHNEIKEEDAIEEVLMEYHTPENESFEKELKKALETVAGKVRSGGFDQTNGGPKDILNVLLNAEEVYCEMPFSFKEETDGIVKIWNGVMDVVYKESGKWHIVDYKTNLDGKDLDKKYEGQLNAYIQAFKSITGEDADARIYHIEV